MDYTARMAALLGRMRRERNGAVADAMRCYGKPCGLNYGVSLPTVRQIAREEGRDHALARLLWQQDVRELRLAALHIADPTRFSSDEARDLAGGICNSELAEEAAFALLSRAPQFDAIFREWLDSGQPLLVYAVLLGAARSEYCPESWLQPALNAVRQTADPDAKLVARGAAALLEALGRRNETGRQAVLRAVDPAHAAETAAIAWLREELQWRLAE